MLGMLEQVFFAQNCSVITKRSPSRYRSAVTSSVVAPN